MEPRLQTLVGTEAQIAVWVGEATVRLTDHAIERYQQRVELGCSGHTARVRLEQMIAFGRTRSTPRHWMRDRVSPTPGLRFLYWAQCPNICALLFGNAVVTVVTRSMFEPRRPSQARRVGRPRTLGASRWRWNGQIADDFEAAQGRHVAPV